MHWFLDPITKHYFDFEGTAGRQAFWMFNLYYFIIAVVLGVIGGLVHFHFLGVVLGLAVFLPSLGLGVRRLHDIGKSGLWFLIGLIPILGGLYLIYLFAQPSSTPYGSAAAA